MEFKTFPRGMREPVEALTDRGYRGKKRVGNMAISIPSSGSPGQSYYQKRKARKKFCKRAGIEMAEGQILFLKPNFLNEK